MACPLCRKEFTLPSNGVGGLPKNFFVGKFLQMKELSSKRSPCEACSGDEESRSEVQNVASVYCVQCQMKLCLNCKRVHEKSKLTRSHKLAEIGDKTSEETLFQSMTPSYCDQHQDKSIEIYCMECKVAICIVCYIELHNSHKYSDVNNVKDDFRKQMTGDIDHVATGVEKCREILESLEKEKNLSLIHI